MTDLIDSISAPGRVADAAEGISAHTVRVTLECTGNGRAALTPRPVSLPWLEGAVGTADWTGVPLAALLREAGRRATRSTSCSPGPTTGSSGVSSRTTSAASRSPTHSPTMCSSRTR